MTGVHLSLIISTCLFIGAAAVALVGARMAK
jgi:hypothetical protein